MGTRCYVYRYEDTQTGEIFYIGKGTGYRHMAHLKPSVYKNPRDTNNPYFYGKIKSMMRSDNPPNVVIEEYFDDEDVAYEYEAKRIKELGTFNESGPLLNISTFAGGRKSGGSYPWSDDRKQSYKELWKGRRVYNPTFDELFRDFITENKTREQIAKENKVSAVLVKKRCQELGIHKDIKQAVQHIRREPFLSREEYIDLYINRGLTRQQIQDKLGITLGQLNNDFKKYGINKGSV